MNNLVIASENGGLIYHFTYQISFLLGLSIFLIAGYKRKVSFTSLLLIGALTGCFLIAGTKLGTYGLDDWKFLFTHGSFPSTAGKTIVTGMLAAVLAIFISKKLLKIEPSLLDASAFVFPVVMILQRFGCLFAGCCYGSPTHLSWGIQYAEHYKIYGRHLADRVAGCSAGLSAPVHPVQLYEVLGYVLIIAVLWGFRRRFRAANSLGLFSLALVFAMRFAVEFFRDPVTNHAWGETWGGLKIVQWIVLGVALVAGLRVWFLEKNIDRQIRPESVHAAVPTFWRQWLVAGMLMAFLWLTYGWFTRLETIVFQFLVLVSLGSLAVSLFRRSTTPQFRWAVVSLAGLALVFMSQTVVIEGIQQPQQPKQKGHFEIGYLKGNLDYQFDEVTEKDRIAYEQVFVPGHWEYDSCDDEQYYVPDHYETHEYHVTDTKTDKVEVKNLSTFGAEMQFSKLKESGNENTMGLGAYGSSYQRQIGYSRDKINSYGFYTWFGQEWKDASWKIGFQIGNLNFIGRDIKRKKPDVISFKSREGRNWIFPVFYGRVGNRYKFYGEIGCGDDLPYGITVSRFRGGVGIGNELFGMDYPFRVTGGAMQYIDKLAFYVDSEIGMGEKLFLAPAVRFGEHPLVSVGLGLKF